MGRKIILEDLDEEFEIEELDEDELYIRETEGRFEEDNDSTDDDFNDEEEEYIDDAQDDEE